MSKHPEAAPAPAPAFSPFWPVFLLSITMIIFLGWQISIGVRQYLQGVRFAEQQELMVARAAEVESNFQALMMDVLELAKTNPDVQAIVRNYNIQFTPSGSSANRALAEQPSPVTGAANIEAGTDDAPQPAVDAEPAP